MVRGRRGRSGGRGNRTTPYDQERVGRDRRRGGRGQGKGNGRGGRGGRRGGEKPKTAAELDAEMDKYWGKSEEHASKKLDSDMDTYWKEKNANAIGVELKEQSVGDSHKSEDGKMDEKKDEFVVEESVVGADKE